MASHYVCSCIGPSQYGIKKVWSNPESCLPGFAGSLLLPGTTLGSEMLP